MAGMINFDRVPRVALELGLSKKVHNLSLNLGLKRPDPAGPNLKSLGAISFLGYLAFK